MLFWIVQFLPKNESYHVEIAIHGQKVHISMSGGMSSTLAFKQEWWNKFHLEEQVPLILKIKAMLQNFAKNNFC